VTRTGGRAESDEEEKGKAFLWEEEEEDGILGKWWEDIMAWKMIFSLGKMDQYKMNSWSL
jgi:hypothetical protein